MKSNESFMREHNHCLAFLWQIQPFIFAHKVRFIKKKLCLQNLLIRRIQRVSIKIDIKRGMKISRNNLWHANCRFYKPGTVAKVYRTQ